MPKSIYTHHYVYRITNILLNKHYYGSRSCKNCNPHDDLGIKYFSSSQDKDFIKDQKEHPEHYRYKIIRIHESRKDALDLEVLLHNKFDVGLNESFYNRSKQTSIGWSTIGCKPSKETRKKLSEARKGEKNHLYGKHHTEDTKKKISEAQKGEKSHWHGKNHTEETRKKISEAKKGEKNPRFKGYYVTPFGTFSSSIDKQIKENNINHKSIIKWCKNNTKIISKMSYAKSKYLQENFDTSIIGKTFADIEFSFETTIL